MEAISFGAETYEGGQTKCALVPRHPHVTIPGTKSIFYNIYFLIQLPFQWPECKVSSSLGVGSFSTPLSCVSFRKWRAGFTDKTMGELFGGPAKIDICCI